MTRVEQAALLCATSLFAIIYIIVHHRSSMREYANNAMKSLTPNHNKIINKCRWVSEVFFFVEARKSVVQMHTASGDLRGGGGGRCARGPWRLKITPSQPKNKSSERADSIL